MVAYRTDESFTLTSKVKILPSIYYETFRNSRKSSMAKLMIYGAPNESTELA